MVRLSEGAFVGLGFLDPFDTDGDGDDIDVWFPVDAATDNLQLERDVIEFEDVYYEDVVEGLFKAGQRRVTGSLVLKADYAKLPDLMRAVLGHDVAPTGAGPYVYTHNVINRGNSAHFMLGSTDRCMIIELYRGGGHANSLYYQGCMPTELVLTFDQNSYVTVTITFIGRGASIDPKSSETIAPAGTFVSPTGQAAAHLQLSGTSYVTMSSKVTIRNGLTFRHDNTAIETLLPAPEGKYEFMLDADIEVDDDTFVTARVDDPEGGLFTGVNSLFHMKSANEQLLFTFNRLRLRGPAEPRIQGKGPLRMQGSWRGIGTTGVPYGLISATITNNESAYLMAS